ncbi:TonB-linked SusC/RagA family outer membrane protein [Maribacter spongiicola]|uniref:TonB-linked SusC/RagA family outer membrane protein n=1 Tax=Maribacter spongiicola TaxID=1206753 RepID=A0A4R7K2R9_9FLAO|nr:TonB-dependent receptor [Maribacter spongiicola]TDT44714.1 TonB-linked SusC/RagA family outer membrane protein [Maribacter spongiicola]
MNQKRDYTLMKSRKRSSFIKTGVLSMLVCLSAQLAQANENTSTSNEVEVKTLQSTITGTVLDDTGQPLPGANVVEKGTTNGTQTDFDGNYSLNVSDGATLVFSYIGFKSTQIAVNGQSTVNATLAEDAAALDEVIVLGYSTQTRGDLTGSVASVDVSEATKAPVVNAASALQGRVSGVTVVQNATPGSPPKINIRGFGTSNNTNPLFIIDGLQTDDPFVLNSINPNDIDQMNVLKDGAAAIYGARASNGVVIITTKGGGYNMDKPIVSVDTYTGVSTVANTPEFLNAQQLGDVLFQSSANDGTAFDHPQYGNGSSAVVPSSLNGYTRVVSYDPITRGPASATVNPNGTDWIDAITRTAIIQSVAFSVANGEENSKYNLSANFLNNPGNLLETDYKIGQIRLNSEFKIGDKIRIGEHFSTAYSNSKGGGGAQYEEAVRSSPLIPLYDDEGRFAGTGAQGTGNSRSPLAQLSRQSDNFNKTIRILGDVYMSAEILNNLTFKTTFGGTLNSFNTRGFLALDPEHSEPLGTNALTERNQDGYSWTFTNTLNYKKTFNNSKIDALAGIESVKDGIKGKVVSRTGFLFETPDFYLLNNGSGIPLVNEAFDSATSLYSLFGSATYSYGDKYFVTGTLRNDTSSRFAGDNKSDTFPSISAGWVVSKEDFISSDSALSWFKLKGSWGQLGNQSLPASNPTINISSLSESLGNYAIDGSSIATGAILSSVGNPNLRWETSEAINAGIELGFFNDKLNLDFEWFNIKTKDLITQDNSLISTTAIDAGAPYVNLGNVENTGFDINLRYKDETTNGLKYGFDINFSHYKNEVTSLISEFQVGDESFRGGAVSRTQVGQPISSFYGREVIGFTDAGRFEYRDVNGDTVIDDNDRTFIGSPHPDFTYGVNFNLGYQAFDLSLFLQGSQGNDIYNYTKIFTDFPTFVDGNRSVRVLDSWTPTNTNATLPALSNSIQNSETQPNSYFVEDGSYLRLKNIQLGYAFPDKVADKIGLDSFRVYIQGTNILTITGYEGFDPEIISSVTGNNLTLGVDSQVVPQSRIFTLGFNLKL